MPNRNKRFLGALLVGVLAVTALAGCGSSASASGSGSSSTPAAAGAFHHRKFRRFPGVRGTVTAISGTTLTVKNKKGKSITVATTASTKVWQGKPKSKTASTFSAIKTGDLVMVIGKRSGGTLTALRIFIL